MTASADLEQSRAAHIPGRRALRRRDAAGRDKCYGVVDYQAGVIVLRRSSEAAVFTFDELGLVVKAEIML